MTDNATSSAPPLPASTHVGAVYLRVRDLAQAADFYGGVLGLTRMPAAPGAALFGAGDSALVGLIEAPDAPGAHRAPGLYHLAILLPDRAQLGAFLQHTANVRARLQGASDHGVSEAIYLADPEGNGIEVYRDRDRSEWPMTASGVEMVTAPLDAQGVLAAGAQLPGPFVAPAGTSMGHVHLRVSSLERGRARYTGVVGLSVTQASYPGALFTSAGGYHHHIGMNTWSTQDRPAPEHGSLGLAWFELAVPDDAARTALKARLAADGAVSDDEAAPFPARVYYDQDGIGLAVTAG
jgi:catechol 2,3-dioxygenase